MKSFLAGVEMKGQPDIVRNIALFYRISTEPGWANEGTKLESCLGYDPTWSLN